MSDKKTTIEFKAVTISDPRMETDLTDISLSLTAGSAAILLLEKHNISIPIAPLATGMITPDSGSVLYRGRDWQEMTPSEQSSARGRIGRVFEEGSWISNLTVFDNIVLAQRYHTDRSEADLRKEAVTIAEELGFSSITDSRPGLVKKSELKRYEWVRALMGNPGLLIMEHPETGVRDSDAALLRAAINKRTENGTAVLWTTTETIDTNIVDYCVCFRMKDNMMILDRESDNAKAV